MVVAAVAYENLSRAPAVHSRVDALLKLNLNCARWISGVPLGDRSHAFLMASRWPDAIKRDKA